MSLAAVTFAEIAPLIGTLLGGGIIGGAVKFRLSGAQRDSIATTATKAAIEVFEASIKQLKTDLEEAHAEAQALQRELGLARKQVGELVAARSLLEGEVAFLRKRVRALENQVMAMGEG